jgi:hypothetical protein
MMVEFLYCFTMNDGLPCRNVVGCWEQRLDVDQVLRTHFSDEELRRVFGGPPKSRLERIMEAANSAVKEEK